MPYATQNVVEIPTQEVQEEAYVDAVYKKNQPGPLRRVGKESLPGRASARAWRDSSLNLSHAKVPCRRRRKCSHDAAKPFRPDVKQKIKRTVKKYGDVAGHKAYVGFMSKAFPHFYHPTGGGVLDDINPFHKTTYADEIDRERAIRNHPYSLRRLL